MGDDQRIYKVTSTGMEKLKELGISSTEMEALKTALAEGIMNSKKKPQIKKDTLCSLLDKLVPNHPWFSLQVPEEGAPLAVIEAGKQDAKKKNLKKPYKELQAVIAQKKNPSASTS